MHQFLPFIVIGLATGAVYGLAGMGLVLTYKTSGIFNFGYGAVAALDVFLFYFLHTEHNVSWPAAAAISLLVFAPLLGLALELLARSLQGASETVKVVATVGLILIVEALGLLWHPTNLPALDHFLPQSTVAILGVYVTWEQIILFSFSAVAAGVLYWFFRSVRLGIVMRGVVDNHELVSMSGDDPVRVRRWAWIIGTVFASVAGLMLAPSLQLDGVTLTTAVFAAFGAAAIGYFANLPLTFAGGLVVGIASALVDKYSATITWIGGLPPALPFVILFLVLIMMPRRRLAQRRLVPTTAARRSYHAPVRVRLAAGGLAVGLLAIVPLVQAGQISLWSSALIDMILFLSLGLLVRRSGQISLCHLAFAAVGAAAFGHFATSYGIPWLPALVLATLVAVPVGAFIAIPAVRVSGVFLALATLGFGILFEQVFYTRSFMFGQSTLGVADPRPNLSIAGWDLSTDTGFYYLLLVITVLVVVTVILVANGRLGRLLAGLADSPLALETQGATITVLKVIVFCISAAMASLAGALTGMLYHFGVGGYFVSFNSLTLVALVIILAVGEPWYAVLGAVAYTVIPGYVQGGTTSTVLLLLFGLGAVTAAYGTRGGTMPTALRCWLDRVGGRKAAPGRASAEPAQVTAWSARRRELEGPRGTTARQGLEVRNLSVYFGGVKAVDGVSLKAPAGIITGLVGPNGAGKTTIFNACSGLNRPTAGQVLLHGADVTREGPAERARRGLGRTFQRTELFSTLTVRQNVAIGREAPLAGGNPLAQVIGSRHSGRLIDAATEEALALTGTSRIADTQAGFLPLGQRRLVELARTLAGPFDMLLLDEPSSGLHAHETEQFGQVLKTVVEERGCGILLVEHDMTLIREVCDRVYVLDFGILIFDGTPEEMHRSPGVRAAYLGDAAPPAVEAHEQTPAASGDRSLRPGE
ncbi:MAG TPA: branched-chain amino acid ABC transporter permease/ATP-binding protein [Streptosporangiaceae bacterium]|nr:branched-chain amino acid ABC transporter permease/ATP-binding protein [Streptosporangiaceae bacterium]